MALTWLRTTASALALLGSLGVALPAHAQQATPAAAPAEKAFSFNIPARDLNGAILSFAETAGVQMFYDTSRVQGLRNKPVSGTLTARDALGRLLDGTGIAYRFTGPTAVALDSTAQPAVGSSGAITVPAAQVEGASVRPVDGYQATRTRTATKTDTPLNDVPQSVSVITNEAVQDQAMQSLADATRYVPGVNMHQGEGNRDQFVFRGNSSSGDLFLNGVRDDVQYYRDLYNIDRIEVLKGSNAMIFGRGGAGGVLNRVTKEADGKEIREVTVRGGMFDSGRVSADVGDRLSPTAAFRLNGVYENSGSYRDHVDLERYAFNPTLTLDPRDDTRIKLSYEYSTDDRTADRGIPSMNGKPFKTDASTFFGNPDLNFATVDAHHINATIEHETAIGVKIRNTTQYSNVDRMYQNIYPNAAVTGGLVRLEAYNNATQRFSITNQTDLTAEVETGPLKHKVLLGTEFSRQDTHSFRNTGRFNNATTFINVSAANPTSYVPVTFGQFSATDANGDTRVGVSAIYAQDQIAVTPWLDLIGGVRFDSFDVDYHNNRNGQEFGRTDNVVSPRAGIVVKPVEPLSVYASYSQSYLPSTGDQFSALAFNISTIKPEAMTNYEIGAKWDINPSLNATAAIFRLDRENTRANDSANPGFFVATGSQRTEGLELGITGRITDQWQVLGGYTNQDANVTAGTTNAVKGATVALVPQNAVSLWNRYDVTSQWGVGLGIIHQSDVFANIADNVTLPSFTRADMAVFYKLNDRLRAQLNVENLFDTTYYLTADQNNNITPGSPIAVRATLVANF